MSVCMSLSVKSENRIKNEINIVIQSLKVAHVFCVFAENFNVLGLIQDFTYCE